MNDGFQWEDVGDGSSRNARDLSRSLQWGQGLERCMDQDVHSICDAMTADADMTKCTISFKPFLRPMQHEVLFENFCHYLR